MVWIGFAGRGVTVGSSNGMIRSLEVAKSVAIADTMPRIDTALV